jgi:tetratricopeptide (TPR) repeat protein
VLAWRAEEMKGTSSAYRCRFSPDGRWLLTGGRSLHLWDARTGRAGPAPPGVSGSFTPTGDRLATMLGATGILVWSVESGKPVAPPLETHDLQETVHFSSDGRWVLASGTAPQVWDAESGTVLAVLDRRSWIAGGWSKGTFFLPANAGVALGEIVPDEGPTSRLMVWRFARDQRPVPELVELSSLLAGYRVVEGAGAPVALTPEEMKQAWERLGEAHRNAAVLPAEKVVAWHRRLGDELAEEGRLDEALSHFDAAVELGPPRATVFERRGNLRAERGRLEEAEADFNAAARLRPGFPDLASHAALLRGARGDAAGLRRVASDLLREFGTTRNPDRGYWIARTCALVPDHAELDRPLVVRLADVALPLSGIEAEVLDLRGAALYRAGRHEEARERLLAAVKARGRATPWEAAFLAMVHHRIGAPDEGRRWLGRAVVTTTVGEARPAWTERLEGAALMGEARALLGLR